MPVGGPVDVSSPGKNAGSAFYASATSPGGGNAASPKSGGGSKSVEEILAEKKAAAEALQSIANQLHRALLERGVDVANPPAGQTGSKVRLPLSYFDNLDLEPNTPEGWVQHSRRTYGKRPNAILLLPDGSDSGGAYFRPGRVSGYDASKQLFTASPSGIDGRVLDDQSVTLPRLHVMFLSEKVDKFAARVAEAHRARDECEAALLLRFYVKNMPTQDVRTLNELQVASLLERTLTTTKLRSSDVDPNELIDEVKLDYAHSINGMLLKEGLQRPPLRDKFPTASLLQQPPPAVPELGVIAIPDSSYPVSSESFLSISSLVMPEVVHALIATRNECLQLERLSLFNIDLNRSLRLDDFEQLQSQHTIKTLQFLRESWQPAIKKVVGSSLRDVDPERWDSPPPMPAAFADPEDISDAQAAAQGGGANDQSNADDLLAASLMASGDVGISMGEFPRPDTRAFRLMNGVNFRMSDAIRRMTQESMRSYVSFLTAKFDTRSKLEEPGVLPYQPLFEIDVLCEGGELQFSDPPALFVDVGVKLLDEAIAAVGEVTEVDLFDKSVSIPMTLHPLSTVDATEEEVLTLREQLTKSIDESTRPLEEYLESLRPHEELLQRDEGAYVRAFEEAGGPENPPTLEQIKAKVEEQRAVKAKLEDEVPSTVLIGTFLLHTQVLKDQLLEKIDRTCELLMRLICERARQHAATVSEAFTEMFGQLDQQPSDIEKLTEISEFMATLTEKSDELEATIQMMTDHYEVLEDLQFEVPQEDFTGRWETFHWPLRLKLKQEECNKMLEEDRNLFQKEMTGQQTQFEKAVEKLNDKVDKFGEHTSLGAIKQVVAEVKEIEQTLKDYEERARTFNSREALFGQPVTEYEYLPLINKNFEPYRDLWLNSYDWQNWQREWMDGPMVKLDPDEVEKSYTNATRAIAKAGKVFKEAPVGQIATQIKQEMDDFRPFMPVVTALRNPGMRDRHWAALSEDLGFDLHPDENFTLRHATEVMKLHDVKTLEKVQKVAERAMKEYAIEKSLDDMEAGWDGQEFEVMPYRNTGSSVIKISEEMNTLLDDQIVLTQQFSFSPYKGPFEERIADWERKLRLVQEVTTEWLGCQRNWMYLQPIFDSEDINRQLPQEGKRFSGVDRQWRKTLERVKVAPVVLTFCDDDELLEQWIKSNAELERVQKNLADYLETKRAAFARFYFLSNDELISILSQTKDPNAVQPHLRKCFEAVHSIKMEGANCEMSNMVSPEKETVDFVEKIYPTGSVEVWMGVIEQMMRLSVRHATEVAMEEYPNVVRGQFVLSHSSMVVIAVTQTFWTRGIEAGLNEGVGVQDYYNKMLGQLQELSQLVRGDLSKLKKKIMSALVVIEVHARDVVERLIEANVSKVTDFEWISQLRYYWEATEANEEMRNWASRRQLGDTNVVVRMVQCNYPYGYEYLGASARLVVTPLTDRCYMTLMGALHIKLGGAPAGPAGTGKTESVKDLAKALAKQCVVFNCSDGLDYLAMAKFFKGLSTAGAWACFDEFNRIDIEVLSVIAQQILTITNAIVRNAEWFEFEGTNVKLDPTTATYITMNPGYAGRSELPDNLKALFRCAALLLAALQSCSRPFVLDNQPSSYTLSLPALSSPLPSRFVALEIISQAYGDDGARLRAHCRDPPLLLWLRQVEAARAEARRHLPPLVGAALVAGSLRLWHARRQHRHPGRRQPQGRRAGRRGGPAHAPCDARLQPAQVSARRHPALPRDHQGPVPGRAGAQRSVPEAGGRARRRHQGLWAASAQRVQDQVHPAVRDDHGPPRHDARRPVGRRQVVRAPRAAEGGERGQGRAWLRQGARVQAQPQVDHDEPALRLV